MNYSPPSYCRKNGQLIIDSTAPSSEKTLAGISGMVCATRLLIQLDTELQKEVSFADNTFEEELKNAYRLSSEHRRVGVFHSFLIAISKALSAIKACFVTPIARELPPLELGQTDPRFFAKTTRQKKVCEIKDAKDALVNSTQTKVVIKP